MIRTAIKQALKTKKISQRKCALDNGLDYSNFASFLRNERAFPIPDIEKVLKYLNLEINYKKEERE